MSFTAPHPAGESLRRGQAAFPPSENRCADAPCPREVQAYGEEQGPSGVSDLQGKAWSVGRSILRLLGRADRRYAGGKAVHHAGLRLGTCADFHVPAERLGLVPLAAPGSGHGAPP